MIFFSENKIKNYKSNYFWICSLHTTAAPFSSPLFFHGIAAHVSQSNLLCQTTHCPVFFDKDEPNFLHNSCSTCVPSQQQQPLVDEPSHQWIIIMLVCAPKNPNRTRQGNEHRRNVSIGIWHGRAYPPRSQMLHKLITFPWVLNLWVSMEPSTADTYDARAAARTWFRRLSERESMTNDRVYLADCVRNSFGEELTGRSVWPS